MSEQLSEFQKLAGFASRPFGSPASLAFEPGKMPPPPRLPNPLSLNDESSYVTRYTPKFKIDFATGTSIAWDILFSDSIGGNFDTSTDHIYITAWNRAAFGCEVLIGYFQSTAPTLMIFDHQTGGWTYQTPVSQLATYVSTLTLGTYSLPSLSIVNMTYQVDATNWQNAVNLIEPGAKAAVAIYQSAPYPSSYKEQALEFSADGAYGPTIEPSRTPASPFVGTNPIGWSNAKLSARDPNGTWSALTALTDAQSLVVPGSGNWSADYSEANWAAVLTTPQN